MTPHARLCFLIPLGVAVATLSALVAAGWGGWPGETGVAAVGLCETIRSGPIKQPANTWSNVGFFVAGLWVGRRAWADVGRAKTPGWSNPLVDTVAYPASFASLSILIGTASTALHASTTRWSAVLDLLAMHLWAAWAIAYAAQRLLRGGHRVFAAIFMALAALLLTRIALGEPLGLPGPELFGGMVATAVAVEVAGRLRNRATRLDTPLLVWSVVVFLAAYALELPCKTGGVLCVPDSLLQGHAAWHLLCAASITLVYLYGRSERAIDPPSAPAPPTTQPKT